MNKTKYENNDSFEARIGFTDKLIVFMFLFMNKETKRNIRKYYR